MGSIPRIAAADFSSLMDNTDPFLEPARAYGLLEEQGPSLIGLQEHQGCGRPVRGDHQAGESTTRSQVDQMRCPGAHFSPDQGGKPFGVVQMTLNGARAKEASLSGGLKHLEKSLPAWSVTAGGGHRRPDESTRRGDDDVAVGVLAL